jgi:hypothetical protein
LIARGSIIEKKRTSASGTLKPTWKGSFQKWHPTGLSLPWNLFISAVWHDLRLPFTNCPRWLTNHAPVCMEASCTIHTHGQAGKSLVTVKSEKATLKKR